MAEFSDSLKNFLEEKHDFYNRPEFIEKDPISIPHRFSLKEDIEIAGFFAATIAWGNRTMILNNAGKLMAMMDNAPYDFILNHAPSDLKPLEHFVHRTFNGIDCLYFIYSLKNIYINHVGLEKLFTDGYKQGLTIKSAITFFRSIFLETEYPDRTKKHLANPQKGSAAKRLNMFLRWMIRQDNKGVDFGIWKDIPPSVLQCPLDVHSGNVSRNLKLLKRKANDWKAVEELTKNLKYFDPIDPVKYDFALFGTGINEK